MATITVTAPPQSLQSQEAQELARQRFAPWTAWQRVLFRVALLFTAQLTLPFKGQFYQRLVQIRQLHDIYGVAGSGGGIAYVTPAGESARWGLGSFTNWGIALLIAIALAGIWTWFARNSKRKEYTVAYYWLNFLLRYWVAFNILHYGYLKVYPDQMPYPSISNLHTLIGETAAYRYYWAIIGLSTWYQIVLGCVEVLAGSLLFFRRTAALGALLNLGILYNVAHANFAYDGGVHLLSAEISLLAGLLLVQYIPDIYRLLIKKEDIVPSYYHPVFKVNWQRYTYNGIKYAAWILFIPLYFYSDIHHYLWTNASKEPRAEGLKGTKGYYTVTEFKLNGKELPYSPLDPVRWHDVTFEDYPTITYKVDKPLPIRLENGGPATKDAEKHYELAGFAGGRTYLHYDLDEANQTLTVQDKNADVRSRDPNMVLGAPPAKKSSDDAGADSASSDKNKKGRGGRGGKKQDVVKYVWHYSRPSDSRIILTGSTPDKQEFYAVLDRVQENQAIHVDSPIQGEPLVYSRQFGRRFPVRPKSFDGTTDTPNRDQDKQ
ncbi:MULTISPECIES: hypothetical protein [Acidobacteriaceae]|uniref:hypothetical protein n=1 Tax=Acidobacteriaceae TaxID=204434 RepID=UPI00131D0774|nr:MULTISPECIES: hypothetical protein [Acidobacteriaceae]MDW5266056.1 hypothetical protein [Edaphobacter sp.]